jgi:putative endonuclease
MATPWPVDRRARGALVEAAARRHLIDAGLHELAANANYRGGELDLVMRDGSGRDGDCVVFVEVRYRSHKGFGGGAMSVDAGKRRKLVHAAQLFLATHRELRNAACRFDVVEADGDPAAPRITWLRDAFRADELG